MGIKKDSRPDPNATIVRRIVIQASDSGDGVKLDKSVMGVPVNPEYRNVYAVVEHFKTTQGAEDELIQGVEVHNFVLSAKTISDLEKALAKVADEIAASFFDIAPANELVREGKYYKEKKKA